MSSATTMKYLQSHSASGTSLLGANGQPSLPSGLQTCSNMCSKGCAGADCHCDSYDHENSDHQSTSLVCAAETDVVTACHDDANCEGFTYDMSTNMATMYSAVGSSSEDTNVVESRLWLKKTGAACTHPEDYSTTVG